MNFVPRPKQAEVLAYPGGRMAVLAVPGSGKTVTLARLAADIIASGELEENQEVLIVTLVNSAVDNFYQRVSQFTRQRPAEEAASESQHRAVGLLPRFRVRTLHGLAHDIVRERPDLLGLADDFQIVDENEAEDICAQVARAWLHTHPHDLDEYLSLDLEGERLEAIRREQLPRLLNEVGMSFIRAAKDQRLTPERLVERLKQLPVVMPLAEMGAAIYDDYQRALIYRGAVDFDDLIRLALQALETDEELLARLRQRWPYILEDEAQDSSQLQEQILTLLSGAHGNWVRVGDPNQAIYETFTTANPRYLRAFSQRGDVLRRHLPNSGRSTLSIIALANFLVEWTMSAHPIQEVRDALSAPPWIEPAPPGDPQPNPEDRPGQVHLIRRNFTPQEEIQAIVSSLARWLPDHPEETVAVLVPRNERAEEIVEALKRKGIEVVESLLRSTTATRRSAGILKDLLRSLADPGSPSKLAEAYKAWRKASVDASNAAQQVDKGAEYLRRCGWVEGFLWPQPGEDPLESVDDPEREPLRQFRELMRQWQAAVLLPTDQLLLTLARDVFILPADLALAHKVAGLLRRASETHPAWRLPELTEELSLIARNERRFLGFSQDDTGFDPDRYKGRVVVATMHKAKGLEWDRVYLVSVNNYDFPSGMEGDQYIAEKWFLRDQLNLQAEALAQLEAVLRPDEFSWYTEGLASRQARLDYVRERLRLLYVGITRARKELVITYNTGRMGDLGPAVPLVALSEYWKERMP